MLCLGRHWNARTYTYEDVPHRYRRPSGAGAAWRARRRCRARRARRRVHVHAGPVHRELVQRRPAGWGCIRTRTRVPSRSRRGRRWCPSRSATPRASCSAGCGAASRSRRSSSSPGDAFVFGGPARLRYHGVTRILPGTAPRRVALRRPFESDLPAVSIRASAPAERRSDPLVWRVRRAAPRRRPRRRRESPRRAEACSHWRIPDRYKRLLNCRPTATASGMPSAMPMPTSSRTSFTNRLRIAGRCAPRARRMPISRVRRTTA